VEQKVLDYSLIRLETSPLTAKTIQQLKDIPGIDNISVLNDQNNGNTMTIEIRVCERGIDIRPQISDLVVKSGAKLYTIKRAENMLERAYLEALRETSGGKP
jgi:hypothetical protein